MHFITDGQKRETNSCEGARCCERIFCWNWILTMCAETFKWAITMGPLSIHLPIPPSLPFHYSFSHSLFPPPLPPPSHLLHTLHLPFSVTHICSYNPTSSMCTKTHPYHESHDLFLTVFKLLHGIIIQLTTFFMSYIWQSYGPGVMCHESDTSAGC